LPSRQLLHFARDAIAVPQDYDVGLRREYVRRDEQDAIAPRITIVVAARTM
jgi:hypothetical protein